MKEYSCKVALGGCELFEKIGGGLLKTGDVRSRLSQSLSINENFDDKKKFKVLKKSIQQILSEINFR